MADCVISSSEDEIPKADDEIPKLESASLAIHDDVSVPYSSKRYLKRKRSTTSDESGSTLVLGNRLPDTVIQLHAEACSSRLEPSRHIPNTNEIIPDENDMVTVYDDAVLEILAR